MDSMDSLFFRLWDFVDRGRGPLTAAEARSLISALADADYALSSITSPPDYLGSLAKALEGARSVVSRGAEYARASVAEAAALWRSVRGMLRRAPTADPGDACGLPAPERPRLSSPTAAVCCGAGGLAYGAALAGLYVRSEVMSPLSAKAMKLGHYDRPSPEALRGADVLLATPPEEPLVGAISAASKSVSPSALAASPIGQLVNAILAARPKAFAIFLPVSAGEAALSDGRNALQAVVEGLSGLDKYVVSRWAINYADYGAPVDRRRLVLVGVRSDVGARPTLPQPTHARARGLTETRRWCTLLDVLPRVRNHHAVGEVDEVVRELMDRVPPGGNWTALPEGLRGRALGGAADNGGGRTGFLRRLAWFEPAPSLTSRPGSRATTMLHPWEDRPLSVGEYMALVGLPDGWPALEDAEAMYSALAMDVPVWVSYAVAKSLAEALIATTAVGAPPTAQSASRATSRQASA